MSNKEWVANQWQGAELEDGHLTKRAIRIGEVCLKRPDGSLPQKFRSWGDMKGAYHFFNFEGVSHEALQKVHNKNVREMAANSN